jgi:hypothetical protein
VLEIGVHRGGEDERVDGVVTDDLTGPPRVFRVGEAGIELVLRGALAHPREHPRLVLVGPRVARVALR